MELTGPHAASASELKARLEAEREKSLFLVLREAQGTQRIVRLSAAPAAMTIGRSEQCDLASWDGEVSRVHAELVRVGDAWALEDGGLSRNGSYVNGERLVDRRRLAAGRHPALRPHRRAVPRPRDRDAAAGDRAAGVFPGPGDLSNARSVRSCARAVPPLRRRSELERPATNGEIAAELVLSLEAVKGHLRLLFAKFEVSDLPQNEKRLRLAERALAGERRGEPRRAARRPAGDALSAPSGVVRSTPWGRWSRRRVRRTLAIRFRSPR